METSAPSLFAIRHPDGTVSGDGVFEVYPAQYRFITNAARRNKLFIGGRGAGKTWALILLALYLALLNPGCDGVISGRTFKESGTRLKKYWDKAVVAFEAATGVKLVHSYNKSLQRARLANGSVVWFKGFDQPDKIRGDDLAWIVLDELEFGIANPRHVWDVVNPAVRQPGAKVLQVAAATTPNGIGGIAGHFYRQQQVELHPQEHGEEELQAARDHFVVHAKMMDNPWLDSVVKRQITTSVSGRMYKQEVLGLILSPEDVVFSEFELDRHAVDWRWQPKLPYLLAIDWGTSHAYFAAIQIVDRKGYGLPVGSWVVAEERKLERTSYHAVRKALTEFVRSKRRKPRLGCADKAVKSENAWFRQHFGTSCLTCRGDQEQIVRLGVELLRYMLDPYEGTPRLYFSRRGLNMDAVTEEGRGIIGALSNYQYAKDRTGVVLNKPLKDNINDHPIDALRYAGVTTRLYGEFHGGQPLPFVFPERLTYDAAA